MRLLNRTVLAVALLSLITTASCSEASKPTDPPLPSNFGCQKYGVHAIFARGSDEDLGDRHANEFFKSFNLHVQKNDKLKASWAELGNLDLSIKDNVDDPDNPNEYPAVGFNPLNPNMSNDYQKSVAIGVDELKIYLEARATACPDEVIVLGGYSQGAEVIGTTLFKLNKNTLSRTAYVALYGDPKYNVGCTEAKAMWVKVDSKDYTCHGGIFHQRSPYIPEATTAGSWCDPDDTVCTGKIWLHNLGSHAYIYADKWIKESMGFIVPHAIQLASQLDKEAISTSSKQPDCNPEQFMGIWRHHDGSDKAKVTKHFCREDYAYVAFSDPGVGVHGTQSVLLQVDNNKYNVIAMGSTSSGTLQASDLPKNVDAQDIARLFPEAHILFS